MTISPSEGFASNPACPGLPFFSFYWKGSSIDVFSPLDLAKTAHIQAFLKVRTSPFYEVAHSASICYPFPIETLHLDTEMRFP